MRRLAVIFSAFLACFSARAQFLDCTTGLLSSPSADMNPDGTFVITNNYLNENQLTETGWGYDTFGYGFDITIFNRVEVAYVLTILDGKRRPEPTAVDEIMFNQDRHFSAKFLLLRAGEIWKWTPSIAIGIVDPTTGASKVGYLDPSAVESGNGYFNRFYIVATKHFATKIGDVGATLGYQYSLRLDRPINGPCGGITWEPKWTRNRWFNPTLIAEYDSRTPNLGPVPASGTAVSRRWSSCRTSVGCPPACASRCSSPRKITRKCPSTQIINTQNI